MLGQLRQPVGRLGRLAADLELRSCGVHSRGVFARAFAQHGVLIRQSGVESPEQIGRVERHGGLFKAELKRMVDVVQGFDDMKVAVAEAVSTKEQSQSQRWILTFARDLATRTHLGPSEGQLEPGTAFARRADLEFRPDEHSYAKTVAGGFHKLC